MSNEEQTDKRTATQKIDDLERGLMAIYQTADNMARDVMVIKDALKLLGNKVDSTMKASVAGEPLTDEVVSKYMILNNVAELKAKVDNLIARGTLVPQDTITENSFVVGEDVDDQGEMKSPRLQFVLAQIGNPEFQAKFLGAQVGQTLDLEEGKNKFKVTEIYDIQNPKAPEVAPVEAATPALIEEAAPVEQATSTPVEETAASLAIETEQPSN